MATPAPAATPPAVPATDCHEHAVHGYITAKDDYLKRLKRIEGQARGLQRMVDDEKYCIDILTQIQAARSALRAVELRILKKHVDHCVRDAFASGSPAEADRKMDELLRVMKKPY